MPIIMSMATMYLKNEQMSGNEFLSPPKTEKAHALYCQSMAAALVLRKNHVYSLSSKIPWICV